MRHADHRPARQGRTSAPGTTVPGGATVPDDPAATRALHLLRRLEPSMVLALADGTDAASAARIRPLPPDPRCGGAGLFTMTAPATTTVVGTSFLGRSTPAGTGSHCRVDVVVSRTGTVLSRVHHEDGTIVPTPGPAGGVVVDSLHRMLGLGCPGGTPPLTDLVAAIWLHEVLGLWAGGRPPWWAEVVAVHPDPPASRAVPPSEEALAESIAHLARSASWDGLHRAAVSGRMTAPELTPAEAAWMDTTFFSRWMMESFRPAGRVLETLRQRGADRVADRIAGVLARLDDRPI